MIHERKSIAHLQPSKPLGLQAQRRLTGNILCGSMFSKRNVTSWATPDGCTGTVLPLHALFIPQAERKVNEPLYPDCATVRFCNSSVHRSVLLWSTYLNGETILDFPMSHWLFPASVQGRYFNNTILSTRWYPCKKIINLFHSSYSRRPGLQNEKRIVQVIWEEDTSWLKSSMLG